MSDEKSLLRDRYVVRPAPVQHSTLQGGEDMLVTFPDGTERVVNVWNYEEIYTHPFLYEAIYLDSLAYNSPAAMATHFAEVVEETAQPGPFRVLDFAAGSGLHGEEFRKRVSCEAVIGVDLTPAARTAALRDHPTVYDAYYTLDALRLTPEEEKMLRTHRPNVLVVGSATGTDPVFPSRYVDRGEYEVLLNVLEPDAYVIVNLREHMIPTQEAVFGMLQETFTIISQKRFFCRYLLSGESLYNISYVLKRTA